MTKLRCPRNPEHHDFLQDDTEFTIWEIDESGAYQEVRHQDTTETGTPYCGNCWDETGDTVYLTTPPPRRRQRLRRRQYTTV